jgi:hypothetical protein
LHTGDKLFFVLALHELDPAFRKVTLENDRLQALVRDLKFHQDPVGMDLNLVCHD